jgi:CDP-diglyceride synthetase
MTSRGSLAYYLAAWVCGCFFMAVGFWISLHIFRGPSSQVTFQNVSLLGFAFFGLIFGAVPALLFGWILRRLMKLFHVEAIWVWIVAGAVLAVSLIWCLGSLGQLTRDPRYLPYSALPIWPFLLVGPLAMMEGSLWMTLPVGALTAAVLFAVYRAFEQQAES